MIRMGIECGQRVWRKTSWRRTRSNDNLARFRTFPRGFAVGPIMVWRTR